MNLLYKEIGVAVYAFYLWLWLCFRYACL